MKRIVFLLPFFNTLLGSFTAIPNKESLDAVIAKAQEKPAFILIATERCAGCKQLKNIINNSEKNPELALFSKLFTFYTLSAEFSFIEDYFPDLSGLPACMVYYKGYPVLHVSRGAMGNTQAELTTFLKTVAQNTQAAIPQINAFDATLNNAFIQLHNALNLIPLY